MAANYRLTDCATGKVGYPNVRAARRAISSCEDKRNAGKRSRREQSFYLCEFCRAFHLTAEPENGNTRFR